MNNECIYCGQEFTKGNPCWNDDGFYLAEDGVTVIGHDDGECKACTQRLRDLTTSAGVTDADIVREEAGI